MKRYYNETSGEWYYEGQSMTRSIGSSLFSGVPTAEQLVAWGFEEWVEPEPLEPTEEELLEKAKIEKIQEIEEYDSSGNVNSFMLGEVNMWLTVEERQQIATQITANETIGRNTMTRWFGGQSFTFPIETWKSMLIALEVYAGDALNVTEEHKAIVNSLLTIQDIEDFDITEGYPTKLNFDNI